MTLVVAQALQVPSTMGSGWFALLEAASSSLFFAAAFVCGAMLLQHLLKEFVLCWEKKNLSSSEDLPNLMNSSGQGSKGFGDLSLNVDGSKK